MAILELIRNSTPYSLYANASLSNRGYGINEIILEVEILNIKKKLIFGQKYIKIL